MGSSVEQQKHSSSTSTQRRTVDNMRIILVVSLLVGSVWSLPGITKRSTRVGPKQDKQTGIPINPPDGQRCSGRDYQGRRCCTPENPCDEGEGDCDGPGDGGFHDGHAGCKGDLVCGSNNCKKFGHYYHEKDDCCEKPTQVPPETGWTAWSEFGSCRVKAGSCKKTRTRYCRGPNCPGKQHSQDRPCSCGGNI